MIIQNNTHWYILSACVQLCWGKHKAYILYWGTFYCENAIIFCFYLTENHINIRVIARTTKERNKIRQKKKIYNTNEIKTENEALYEHMERWISDGETILSIKTFTMILYKCNKHTIVVKLQFIHRVTDGILSCLKYVYIIWRKIFGLERILIIWTHEKKNKIILPAESSWVHYTYLVCTWIKIDLLLVFLPTINLKHSFEMFERHCRIDDCQSWCKICWFSPARFQLDS